jgi:predicted ATP-dependent protease
VARKQFHIYPVRTIDEGLEILMAVPSTGERGIESINEAAARRLKELAVGLKEFAAPSHNGAAESKS